MELLEYNQTKERFMEERKVEDGYKIMGKVTELINELGKNFLQLNGGALYTISTKLTGYKFYLADYVAELDRMAKNIHIEIKNIKAQEWDKVTQEIIEKDGKVKNKEQVQNLLEIRTNGLQQMQILYDTYHDNFKIRLSAIDNELTTIAQRIKELSKEQELKQY